MSSTASESSGSVVIKSVECRRAGAQPVFQLIWERQSDFPGEDFYVLVTDSAQRRIAGVTSAASPNGGTWTATADMNASADIYYAQVGLVHQSGGLSAPVVLLFAAATEITTRFDGVNLDVGWAPLASKQPASSMQILLHTPAGDYSIVWADAEFGQMMVPAALRSSGGEWSVYLSPQFGISVGPQSEPATVYNAYPSVEAASVLGAEMASNRFARIHLGLVVMVRRPNAPETAFVGVLKTKGVVVQTSAPVTGTWTHEPQASFCSVSVQFAYPMNLAVDFEVAVAQSSSTVDVAVGPVGVGSALFLMQPQGIAATVAAQGDDRVVTAALSPISSPNAPTGSRMAVTGPNGFQNIGDIGFGLTQSHTLTGLDVGGAYALFGALASGVSVGPWSGGLTFPGDGKPAGVGLPLITSIPALSEIAVDNGVAYLTWAAIADAGLTGYRVAGSVAGDEAISGVFADTRGNLALNADGVAFSIAGVAGPIVGPAAAPVTAITAPPRELTAAWTSQGAQCALAWQAPSGSGAAPDGYKVAIYNGGSLVHQASASTNSYVVPPNVLTAAGGFSFRVSATRSGTPALAGPWSAPAQIVSAAPGSLAVDYDGAALRAQWAPQAAGYRVALLLNGAEAGDPWFTAEPATSVALPFDSAKAYSLAVQATGPGTAGPAASAPVFGAGFYPQFAVNTAPALIPARAPDMAPYEIAIGLPQIFVTAPTGPLPSVPPFALSAGAGPYAYVLTIAGEGGASPWTFTAEPIRAALRSAYKSFLGELETRAATAIGMQTVQAAIARAMPQTFAETLLYAYDFADVSGNAALLGYAALLPGMTLRAEYESYLTMGAASNLAKLNGFIASAVAHYQITRAATAGRSVTALDAFIASLVGQGAAKVPQPPLEKDMQAGGGGLIDSGYALMQQPFLRLVYPQSFPGTNDIGTAVPQGNAALLAASKLSDLDTATDSMRKGKPAGPSVCVLYFRGRATLTPQLPIFVDGVQQYVSLGATLGQILAQRGMDPPAVNLPLTGIKLRRGVGAALVGSPMVYDVGGGTAVRLDWAPSGNAALSALPLLAGDRIEFSGGGSAT